MEDTAFGEGLSKYVCRGISRLVLGVSRSEKD